jgi:4-aminobutyrate aminotransferase-like enzyme/Ser/Thr protein kinase RdoA (MazF antagonist)
VSQSESTPASLVQAPPPVVTELEAATLVRDEFGVIGSARSLGSNQDLNFVIDTGTSELLLKIANPETDSAELEAQSRAAAQVVARTDIRVPLPRTLVDGTSVRTVRLRDADGGECLAHARLLEFLPGRTLSGGRHLAPDVIAAIGGLAAAFDRALADFENPGADRANQWDLRRAPDALADLLPSVADDALRTRLRSVAEEAWASVARVAESLPVQVIHGDLTDDNVVTTDGRMPDGVIDLGDLNRTWRVAELAITLSSLLHHDGVDLHAAMAAVAAYHERLPLTDAEVDALWPLVALRGAVLVASAHHVLRTDPGNEYAAENLVHEELILAAAVSVPLPVATALVRRAVGADAVTLVAAATAPLLPDVSPASIAVVDLSPTSPLLHEGRWLRADIEAELARDALAAGAGIVATRFGEARLTRARPGQAGGDVVVLAVDLTLRQPLLATAPWSGRAERSGDGLVLCDAATGLALRIAPVDDGSAVLVASADDLVAPAERASSALMAAGRPLARIAGTVRVSVAAQGVDVPDAVPAAMAMAWRGVVADPTPLIFSDRVPPASTPTDATTLVRRRDAAVATVQEHYFTDPPIIVRGWKQYLIDADARVYLDALNNVTSIGHAHPRLVEAVSEQWRLINTNSRFLHPAIVEFAERLAALLPEGLDQVFLVNSGSEAVDLALRLAHAHTGRRDVLAVREAYHGWTSLTDAVSTSVADNPNAIATRPEWVHTVEAPNGFRGRYRGADAAAYAVDAAAELDRLAAVGTPVGAFVAETLFGNAGGIPLPDGYLRTVYGAVRAHGGVAVADEVQVGYGRLGEWFWGFEQQDVVPDVVAVAKAMGNGHPLGAVITTRAIAESYRTQGYFFSSAGGSPVSSVVGLTVLDVIRDERLQQNARDVGTYLKDRLLELGERHPILGTVHGFGFYLGPEFVRDRETWEPATAETAAICERMRRLGVMIQPTGDHQNVLKVKPPMCITRDDADAFVAALDRALTTGW